MCTNILAMAEYLGEFEHLVLLAVARLGDDAHGVTIRQTLRDRAGRSASFGAIYSTVRRLEEKGLLRSRLGESTPVRGGRARKQLALTSRGRAAMNSAQRAFRVMADGIDS